MKPSLRAPVLGLVAVAVQALMLTAFAWPAARIAPRHLPLVVAGPEPAVTSVARRLDAEHHGAFTVRRVPDESAARRALTGRRAYGAVVVGPSGPRVLVASAASPAVAQLLTQLSQRMAATPAGRGQGSPAPGRSGPVPVPQDVVPADRDDPRGAAFGALVLPLVMSGLAGGVLLTLLVGSVRWRAAGLGIFAAGAGLASAAIVQGWLSVLPGPYAAQAAVLGLTTLAVASAVAGLGAVARGAGLGLGIAVMMLLANPLSGVTSAPELLPRPWGAVGQGMPAGAGGTLLRSVAFFDGARAGGPLTVLLVWCAAGLSLLGAGALRARRAGAASAGAVLRPADAAPSPGR